MAKKRYKGMRNPNGYGTVVTLSGNRRKPYEVRVNTRMSDRNQPEYDVLGRYDDWIRANAELVKYNEDPYSITDRDITFSQLYDKFYTFKYDLSGRTYSQSAKYCTKSAYNRCTEIHNTPYNMLRADNFRAVLAQSKNGKSLSHALSEHIKNLFGQMDSYALENDLIKKGYAQFAKIVVVEDDAPGVPFTNKELALLWENADKPYIDTILIYTYSGWRITELIDMPVTDIDITAWTYTGGIKNVSSRNRIVPIHSKVRPFVAGWKSKGYNTLFGCKQPQYSKQFKAALSSIGINTYHTPHDCRHTFASLLNSAGANQICIDRLLGHASKTITTKTYTHKDIEELRKNIELIQ